MAVCLLTGMQNEQKSETSDFEDDQLVEVASETDSTPSCSTDSCSDGGCSEMGSASGFFVGQSDSMGDVQQSENQYSDIVIAGGDEAVAGLWSDGLVEGRHGRASQQSHEAGIPDFDQLGQRGEEDTDSEASFELSLNEPLNKQDLEENVRQELVYGALERQSVITTASDMPPSIFPNAQERSMSGRRKLTNLLNAHRLWFLLDEMKYDLAAGKPLEEILERLPIDQVLPIDVVTEAAQVAVSEHEEAEASGASSASSSAAVRINQEISEFRDATATAATATAADQGQLPLMFFFQRAARCQESCDDEACRIGKKLVSELKGSLDNDMPPGELVLNILRELIHHARDCEDELKCPIPGCAVVNQYEEDLAEERLLQPEEVFHNLRRVLRGPCPFMESSAEASDSSEAERPAFVQLAAPSAEDCYLTDMHRENIGWQPVSTIGDFSSNTMYGRQGVTSRRIVVKKITETRKETRELHEALRPAHPGIVRLLWLWENTSLNHIYVCSEFAGKNLHEYLRENHPGGLEWEGFVPLADQLLDAASFLHSHGILFLGWQSTNVVVGSGKMPQLQLCNFSYAFRCPSDVTEAWSPDVEVMEDLPMLLPMSILAPEIYRLMMLYWPATDIWGAGCLMHELAVSHSVHSHLRHEEPEHFREQVRRNPIPDCSSQDTRIARIIRGCLKIDPEERLTICDLKSLLKSNNHFPRR